MGRCLNLVNSGRLLDSHHTHTLSDRTRIVTPRTRVPFAWQVNAVE
jgi:hypothetical protein